MTDIPNGKVPVVACVVASWRFLLQNWRQFLPAVLIVGVVAGVTPAAFASGGGTTVGETYIILLIANVISTFLAAAILRKAVREEFLAPTGMAFGQDEARLLGVLGTIILLLLPVAILASIVMVVVIFGSMNLSMEQMEALSRDQAAMEKAINDAIAGSAGQTLQGLGIIGAIVLFYFAARLYMVNAATMGERKIVFFQTWNWTKGNVLRVMAAILMTALPAQILSLLAASIVTGVLPGNNPFVLAISGTIASVIGGFAGVPPVVLGAELYKGLRPPGFVAK